MSVATNLERLMLDLINKERAAAGVQPLTLELRLNDASEDHSAWMLAEDVFSHTGAGGSNAGDRMRDAGFVFSGSWAWGENVAYQSERSAEGFADDVESLHAALMNSSGHHANILNPNYEVLGVGIEIGEYNGHEVVMVTQDFARSSAPMQLDTGSQPSAPPVAQPEPNVAPEVRVDDIELAAGERHGLENLVSYSDADGDAAVRFEIRDANGGDTVLLGGRIVDARGGLVVDAGDLASLQIRAGAAGSSETLQIRASDGEDWGDWDSFVLAAKPEKALDLAIDDFVLAPGESASVADVLTLPEGTRWLQVRDSAGDSNFDLGGREVFAKYGRWVHESQLDGLTVEGDDAPSTQTLQIRAYGPDGYTDWVSFELTTEWDAAA